MTAKEETSSAEARHPAARGARRVRVGVVQMPAGEEREANVARAVAGIREAAAQGAELVCLQELFATPYFCQVEAAEVFDLAEPVDGPTNTAVARAAREAKVSVLSSVFERRAPGLYHNTAVLYGAGPRTVPESNAKKADERLLLDDLRKATKVVALTLLDFLGPQG